MVAAYLYFRRRLELARGTALSATVVYFCGTIFVMEIGFSHLVTPLEALPALVWHSERLLEQPGWRRASQFVLGWFGVLLISSAAYLVFLPILVASWTCALWLFGS